MDKYRLMRVAIVRERSSQKAWKEWGEGQNCPVIELLFGKHIYAAASFNSLSPASVPFQLSTQKSPMGQYKKEHPRVTVIAPRAQCGNGEVPRHHWPSVFAYAHIFRRVSHEPVQRASPLGLTPKQDTRLSCGCGSWKAWTPPLPRVSHA